MKYKANVFQEARSLPDWGKMAFVQYPPRNWTDVLPNASPDAIVLVKRLVTYESGDRMKADEVSDSPMMVNPY